MTIQHTLRNHLIKIAQITTLNDEDDLFALGYLNSLHALQLVTFVEDHWSITLEDEDLTLENFQTLHALTQLITRHTQAQP